MTTFLYPSDPLNPRRVDSEFSDEAAAARSLGHTVLKVDLDALSGRTPDRVLLFPMQEDFAEAIYRGWMLTPAMYADLAQRVQSKGIVLRTSPTQYQRAHELPGWVNEMHAYTAKTVELPATELAPVGEALSALDNGAIFLRDYSKSVKHNPEASRIEANASPEAALATVGRFVAARGELSGNVVFRSFETYEGVEVRTWWVEGNLRLVTSHPDTPASLPSFVEGNSSDWLPRSFASSLSSLALPFVTADFALREDGVVRLIEIGDGQVSGRASSTSPEDFIEALFPLS